ncbi:MAG: TlpA family protein disulfide reductase [Planctomycetes bacterium]|nr:TlpA family protein disulfide reductase [Planctomycetota bacterium]
MQVYLVIGVVSVIVAAAGLMLRKPLAGRAAIPLWSAIAIGGFALGLGMGCGAMHVFGFRWSPKYPDPYVSLTDRIRHPLMPGDRVSLLRSGGWLNGSPPDIGGEDEGIVVLDIWDDWCPICREVAPNLVQVYGAFSNRDVEFVSITCSSESAVRQFVDEFAIPWPSGFSAEPETLSAYGAVDPQNEVSQTVIPTMYVIRRRDGTVMWSSRNARYQHVSGDDLASQLRSAIQAALEAGHASTKDAETN